MAKPAFELPLLLILPMAVAHAPMMPLLNVGAAVNITRGLSPVLKVELPKFSVEPVARVPMPAKVTCVAPP